MSQRFFSLLSIGAIALSAFFTTASASTASAQSAARGSGNGMLKMVMVDQSQFSATQRQAFGRFLQTASLPRTKIGKRCQYYGKPEVWCLLLEPSVAEQVYQQLRGQPVFGSAIDIKEVRRLKGAERS